MGDLTAFVDPASGFTAAYLIYSVRPGAPDGHKRDIIVAKLTPDWLGVESTTVSEITDAREGPAAFYADGVGYFIWTSHVTGWDPNAAAVYHSTSLSGPWAAIGNPTGNATSFGSQSTCKPNPSQAHTALGLFWPTRHASRIIGLNSLCLRLRAVSARRYSASQQQLLHLRCRPFRAVRRSQGRPTLRVAADRWDLCDQPQRSVAR